MRFFKTPFLVFSAVSFSMFATNKDADLDPEKHKIKFFCQDAVQPPEKEMRANMQTPTIYEEYIAGLQKKHPLLPQLLKRPFFLSRNINENDLQEKSE